MSSIRFKVTAISIFVMLLTILAVFGASYITLQTENDRRSVEVMNLVGQNTKQSMERYTESIE